MNNDGRAWSWRHAILKSGLPPTTRHVLLTISCFMNDVGGGCYPTQETIAEASGLSIRSVRDHIEAAIEAGWLVRRQHGFRGQRWANHEYKAAWPDPAKGAAAPAGPFSEGAATGSKGAAAPSKKVRQQVPLILPGNSSNTSPEGEGGGFDTIWKNWPYDHLPDNRGYAERLFANMTPEHQSWAVAMVPAFLVLCGKRQKHPQLVTYLRAKAFVELVDAPPTDPDGDFIITPDRPEWRLWLGWARKQRGQDGVDYFRKTGQILAKTRVPA